MIVGRAPSMTMHARPATAADTEAIARIYNEGIEDRVATFETRLRSAPDVAAWLDGEWRDAVIVEKLLGEAAR